MLVLLLLLLPTPLLMGEPPRMGSRRLVEGPNERDCAFARVTGAVGDSDVMGEIALETVEPAVDADEEGGPIGAVSSPRMSGPPRWSW